MIANDLEDWGSMPGRVMPKTQKLVVDASLLNTKHYKRYRSRVGGAIQGKKSRPPLYLSVVAIEKEAFGSLSYGQPTYNLYKLWINIFVQI